MIQGLLINEDELEWYRKMKSGVLVLEDEIKRLRVYPGVINERMGRIERLLFSGVQNQVESPQQFWLELQEERVAAKSVRYHNAAKRAYEAHRCECCGQSHAHDGVQFRCLPTVKYPLLQELKGLIDIPKMSKYLKLRRRTKRLKDP